MKNGIVLPTWVYGQQRRNLVSNAFCTLERTETDGNKPHLLVMIKVTDYKYDCAKLEGAFDVEPISDPDGVEGTEQTLAYGTQYLFDKGCDTVTWMGDDALFNPEWIRKLRKLIEDKPNALSWSVYRSAYTKVHNVLEENGNYVRVSSICGHGMTFTKEEWQVWGVDWKAGIWDSPYGCTLDMHHIWMRPQSIGERWVTKESWVEHTGKEGLHCRKTIPEYGFQFQGC